MSNTAKYYFSTDEPDILPRTIHYLDKNLILICFNKRREEDNKNDKVLGFGSYKHVHEAFDYRTGEVYARVVKFTEREEECAALLKDISGVVKTIIVYKYESPKRVKAKIDKEIPGEEEIVVEKTVAIQEKIKGHRLSDLEDELTPEQKRVVVTTLLKTLGEIHSLGVFHDDLHRSNILIDQNGHARIIDFGSAKIYDLTSLEEGYGRQKDMSCMADHIRVLYPNIVKNSEGFSFYNRLKENTMSALDALEAFNQLDPASFQPSWRLRFNAVLRDLVY